MPDHTIDIRKIEILKAFSFFEVEDQHKNLVTKSFRRARFNSQKVSVEPAQKRKDKPRRFKRA